MNNNMLKRPIMGVLIRQGLIKKFLKQRPTPRLAELAKANGQVDITLYYFSINDVDMKKKLIKGTYYDKEKNKWQSRIFPYPDVVYKRISSSKKEIHSFEEQIKKLKIQSLNYFKGFNKWQVYKSLSAYESLRPYLPKTILYTNPDDLKKMLDENDKVYLKACRGGRGEQVMRVIKLPGGEYQCSNFKDNLSVQLKKDFQGLIVTITDFFAGKEFIIQEAIDLITVDDCLVDMRPEVQRNGKGEITLAAIPVRIGNKNSPITTHANSYTFEDFFRRFMNYSDEEILSLKNKIFDFLKMLYEAIEHYYGPSGEIGIDIGLDKKGQLWFIECNSQSKKVSFLNSYEKIAIRKSYVNLLEYAKFMYFHKKSNSL